MLIRQIFIRASLSLSRRLSFEHSPIFATRPRSSERGLHFDKKGLIRRDDFSTPSPARFRATLSPFQGDREWREICGELN